jgi:hypothetical protein
MPTSVGIVEELLVERGVEVDHVTVYRRVQRLTPASQVRVAVAVRMVPVVACWPSARPMSMRP